MWDVLTEAAIALDDTGVANSDELMKYRAATDEGVVADMNMPSQQAGIREDVFVSQMHVVREVGTDHEKVPVPQRRGAAGFAASVDGDVLTQNIVRTENDRAFCFRLEPEILRISTDHRSATNDAALSHLHMTDDLGVGLNPAACRDLGRTINDGIRANVDALSNLGLGVNDGSGVNHRNR